MHPDTAKIARLVGDPSRSAMLIALMDGRFHTAKELAWAAGITPQTASFHLRKLENTRILQVEKHGRHRYYRLSDTDVAHWMESLLRVAPLTPVRSLRQSSQQRALREARTCYDHLAGKVGVELTEGMVNRGILEEEGTDYRITPAGEHFMYRWELDLTVIRKKRRSFARCCLDWSERKHHLAGALGHAVLNRLLETDWIRRLPSTRAVQVTEKGKEGLREAFGLDL
ncbi:ArsR/SmtB family transcription factor [Paludifilum halophilum]|uniref:Transcriptional regulator n=1 Tax=Paludifilum halophilum TaxID=1642702 RepID=A0A235B691_9BACL|nr:winged helix-turn-helix domain-containing protein [Paludifilum halophilum]OYD07115.1 transcriptional regulator [Paludifilum halophilum]